VRGALGSARVGNADLGVAASARGSAANASPVAPDKPGAADPSSSADPLRVAHRCEAQSTPCSDSVHSQAGRN